MIRSRRVTLLVIAGVAVLALLVGLGAGQFIRSPADAASRIGPPEASAITVPVELRELETEVRTRADAAFAGSVEVELELGGLAFPPVVTGHVPERGDELVEGEPLLEVVGRPVIALQGELPMYRSLGPGMTGPDVDQLKETLRRLGLNPGGEDQYGWATAQAVAELYRRAGYPAPPADEGAQAELSAVQESVDLAEGELAAAEAALTALQDAAAGPAEVAEAESRVDQAGEAVDEAEDALGTAQFQAITPLPASEVYYLPTLPRHVDEVGVSRGDLAQGTVMSVSGANLQLTTTPLNEADRSVLAEGMPAVLQLPTGEVTGTIVELDDSAVIEPPELSADEIELLTEVGNILVRIPVASTEGEVLAVPLAALTAGPGGESRVEVLRGDGQPEVVVVEVGLVAQGYAEVAAVDGSLAEGDLVVVGESGDADESEEEEAREADDTEDDSGDDDSGDDDSGDDDSGDDG